MEIKGVIFDLDGVITDTAEYHYLAWKRLADEQGIPFNRVDNEALRGVSRRESLNLMLKGRQIPESQAQAWMERKNDYYREMLSQITPADVLPGVLPLLRELRQSGIKIAIASASKNARDVLNSLGLIESIDVLCDGYSVSEPKPAPDLFLFAAQQLGLPPGVCVVVEDAEAGVEAALSAGMRCIGLGPPARVGKADMLRPSLEGLTLRKIMTEL